MTDSNGPYVFKATMVSTVEGRQGGTATVTVEVLPVIGEVWIDKD
eukprot:CAMPEP_0201281346 /NCGR_PEP_ID=MMETSP1317-20130820/2465_1 /ASSEMBLY_ACC=CAM_ASM_000770 /TAXON_ID=187299 /ORGANISM="Undescribed Undescribed, Strain Undescribed" /LENGTH=44 /DNA_ID= /DNA_START= /DNA_END= /DNA_ORIENTATION=